MVNANTWHVLQYHMTRGRLTLKFCKWFENTRFKIPRQRDELHLSDNPTGTALADLVGDNSVGTTRVPVIGTTRDHPPPIQSAPFGEGRGPECAFP